MKNSQTYIFVLLLLVFNCKENSKSEREQKIENTVRSFLFDWYCEDTDYLSYYSQDQNVFVQELIKNIDLNEKKMFLDGFYEDPTISTSKLSEEFIGIRAVCILKYLISENPISNSCPCTYSYDLINGGEITMIDLKEIKVVFEDWHTASKNKTLDEKKKCGIRIMKN